MTVYFPNAAREEKKMQTRYCHFCFFVFFAETNLSFGLKLISADSVVCVFVYFSSLSHLWKL